MTYGKFVSYLRDTALAAGAASFWCGAQTSQDTNYNAAFPQALLFLTPAPLVGANVVYAPTLMFIGKDEHENATNLAEPELLALLATPGAVKQSLAIQDEMDLLSQRFVAQLREDEEFDVSERIDRGAVLRKGSGIGTGFLISFTLTTRAAVC